MPTVLTTQSRVSLAESGAGKQETEPDTAPSGAFLMTTSGSSVLLSGLTFTGAKTLQGSWDGQTMRPGRFRLLRRVLNPW